MECKVRFYFSKTELEKIIERLNNIPELHSNFRLYEKTIMYNHSDPKFDFYDQNINNRFRIKISRNELNHKCKLSWKKKIDSAIKTDIEEKKEVRINPDDANNLIYIIENVMHFTIVESFERYRTIFENNDIEIAVDEYPFGICIKVENKSIDENPEEIVKYWTNKIGLDIAASYKLSWDDKYEELCREQGIDCYKEVTFDKVMPKVNDKFKIDNN